MKAFFAGYNIVTSLGTSISENITSILNEQTGIKLHNNFENINEPTQLSAVNRKIIFDDFTDNFFTTFEKFLVFSIRKAFFDSNIKITDKTAFILSTTKGNIELLNPEKAKNYTEDRINLWKSAQIVANYFNIKTEPIIISNACISGVQAITTATRMIQNNKCDNAIVVGADILTDFVIAGFLSFKSISPNPCKPFDKNRDGLSLGEGVATILLTNYECLALTPKIEFVSGATSNDANHISGPSRTAEGLFEAIDSILKNEPKIDFISAHGTATIYNDDMESVAIKRCNLENVPTNSFKGYFGHTLGAAGIIETALSIYSMQNNILFKTMGFLEKGTVENINIIDKNTNTEVNTVLKIASGFGGSNASLLLKKHS
jgi:3-oxoacyl-[acyl-carrier-protein] synthase-1